MSFDWQGFLYILAKLFALSLVVQLALEPLYRWSGFMALEAAVKAHVYDIGLRWPVALTFAMWVVYGLKYDVLSELFSKPVILSGMVITALAVTGGTAPFLAAYAKIEAMREKSRAVIAQSQAVRADVARVEVVRIADAKIDAAEARQDIAQAEAGARSAEHDARNGGGP